MRQRGGWLGVAHPKASARPASAGANRFAILGINWSVLDVEHNDDHLAFSKTSLTGEGEGGGKSSTQSIPEFCVAESFGRSQIIT